MQENINAKNDVYKQFEIADKNYHENNRNKGG